MSLKGQPFSFPASPRQLSPISKSEGRFQSRGRRLNPPKSHHKSSSKPALDSIKPSKWIARRLHNGWMQDPCVEGKGLVIGPNNLAALALIQNMVNSPRNRELRAIHGVQYKTAERVPQNQRNQRNQMNGLFMGTNRDLATLTKIKR